MSGAARLKTHGWLTFACAVAFAAQLVLMLISLALSSEIKNETEGLAELQDSTLAQELALQNLGVSLRSLISEIRTQPSNTHYIRRLQAQMRGDLGQFRALNHRFRTIIATELELQHRHPELNRIAGEIGPLVDQFVQRAEHIGQLAPERLVPGTLVLTTRDLAAAPNGRILISLRIIGESLRAASAKEAAYLYRLHTATSWLSITLLMSISIVLVAPLLQHQHTALRREQKLAGDVASQAQMLVQNNRELKTSEKLVRDLHARCMEAEQAKQDFLIAISHELNAPLRRIVENCRRLDQSPIDQVQAGDLSDISADVQEASADLLVQVQDVIELMAFDPHAVHLNTALVPLRMLLEDGVQGAIASRKGDAMQVTLRLRESADVSVWCDAERVGRMLDRILQNAIRATPSEGQVDVQSMRLGDGSLEIEVRDQGPGMSSQALEAIPGPLFHTESTDAHPPHSLGLGLAVAKLNAEAHGGQLEARNLACGGCSVIIRLPAGRIFSGEMRISPTIPDTNTPVPSKPEQTA
ncbi:MAG: HAMP domain-containing sensor histidine kinase [Pseudomonadota bacterium]